MIKNYLANLLCLCSEHEFGQDVVDWAIYTGRVRLSYDLDADLRLIMGEPGQPETGQYDNLVEAYQAERRQLPLAEAA